MWTSENSPSTHSGDYGFFEWHNRSNPGKERRRWPSIKRVPNIEELDERAAYSFLTDVFYYGPIPDPEVVNQANHPDDYAM